MKIQILMLYLRAHLSDVAVKHAAQVEAAAAQHPGADAGQRY
jgi:hypothetical protein